MVGCYDTLGKLSQHISNWICQGSPYESYDTQEEFRGVQSNRNEYFPSTEIGRILELNEEPSAKSFHRDRMQSSSPCV